jgi:hypothetical protein
MDYSSLEGQISPAYEKFFNQFGEIEAIAVEDWKILHLISYFCFKYKEYYNVTYTFKYNDVPSKCYESFQFKKLSQMLSSNPIILKNYIDWVFKEKIIKRKKRLTSLGYLTTQDIVNEFKWLPQKQISRTDKLPDNYILILKAFNVTTYGDLSFLNQRATVDDECKKAINLLVLAGFDRAILDKIK